MNEVIEFEKFHPRAVKLLRKKKNFLVIAEDEPYFIDIYTLIRILEKMKGGWSQEDESKYYLACSKFNLV